MTVRGVMHTNRCQLCVFLLILSLLGVVCTMELPPIHWNSSNPMFKASSNDHVVEVNIGDTLDFICPYHSSAKSQHHYHEYFIVHQVSQWEYDNCHLSDNSSSTSIISCTSPRQKRRFTIWFDEFAAIPNVPEFVRGQTYYFITTAASDRDGGRQSRGGVCYHRNMKLQVHVCCSKRHLSDVPDQHLMTKHKKPSVKSLSHDVDKTDLGSGAKLRAQHTLPIPSQVAGDSRQSSDKSLHHRQQNGHQESRSQAHSLNKHQSSQLNQHLTRNAATVIGDTDNRLSNGGGDEEETSMERFIRHRAESDATDHSTSNLLVIFVSLVCMAVANLHLLP